MNIRKKGRKRYAYLLWKCICIGIFIIGIVGVAYSLINMDSVSEEFVVSENIELPILETEELQIVETEMNTEIIAMASLQNETERILSLSAGEFAASGLVSNELTERLFYSTEIDDTLFTKINGVSYIPNEYIDTSELRYLKMLCYDIDGNTYVGEMIVNTQIADKVLEIFQTLYENRYPIERMVLVDNYRADDESSMSANNTSAFNFRQIAGSSKLSNHSYGMAIDINPLYNPYVKTAGDGSIICQPESGREYIDRGQDFPYKIDENDLAYKLFTEAGFTWGGNWNSVKDYQHFEME